MVNQMLWMGNGFVSGINGSVNQGRDEWGLVGPILGGAWHDALTPALSHGEREKTAPTF
jgi:hypothetical protein